MFSGLRGPKLTIFSIGGTNVHASRQLVGLMPVPSLPSQIIFHPRGKGGKSGAGRGPGLGRVPAETLNTEMYVSFCKSNGPSDKENASDMLSSLRGSSMVPSHCWGIASDELNWEEALAASRDSFGRA